MFIPIHQHESATGIHVFPAAHPERPSHLPLHPIPLGCPRALALGALLYASNLHWLSILYTVVYMFSQIIPRSPPAKSKSLFFASVSFAALHVELLVLSS